LKIDKYTKDLSNRLNAVSGSGGGNGNNNNGITKDDDYYLAIGSEPPRFAYYRHVRIEQCTDEWRKKTYECVWDTITQDELDYYLKAKLREPPDQRYQRKKENWFFHDLSYLDQTVDENGKLVDIIKESGCGHWDNNREEGVCVPECKYYEKYGRIEDEEVIKEHNELIDYHKQRNDIVNIDISPDNEDYREFLKMLKKRFFNICI